MTWYFSLIHNLCIWPGVSLMEMFNSMLNYIVRLAQLNTYLCLSNFQFGSVAQSCPTLWDPIACSTPGFPVHYQLQSLPKLMSIKSVMPSKHLILCHPLLLLPSNFPSITSFPVSHFFASGGQSIGASTSAAVLAVNIQGWFLLGLTGLISLQFKGLSRVFSNTTV